MLSIALSSFSQTRSLEYYLQEGLKNSPLLNDIQNQLSSAVVDSLIVTAQRKPQVTGRSGLLYAPYGDNFGYDEVITDGGNYEALGVVSQEIFTGKRVENRFQAIRNIMMGLGINKKITEAELKRTITDLYLESFSVLSDLTFNRSFYNLMSEQDKIMQDFVRAGIFNQSDYLALAVEIREQEIIVSRLNNLYMKDLSVLNEVCGLKGSDYYELQKPEINLARAEIPLDFLFLQQFVNDSLKIINERDALNLRYKPSVNWIADAGFLSSNPWKFYSHFGISAGISLSFPIYDGQQRKLETRKLDISENTRLFYSENYKKLYSQKYIGLKEELRGAREVSAKIAQQRTVADQLVNSLKSQLETGLVTMNDYLTALKNYRNISHNLNLSGIGILRIVNEMNYLTAE